VTPAGQIGLQNVEDTSPILRALAGPSGRQALAQHATEIGNTVAGSEAGLTQGQDLSAGNLIGAREAPNSVYDRLGQRLPTGSLTADPQTVADVQSAGNPAGGRITVGSPQAQPQIESLRAQLLDPNAQFTGPQLINEMRGLRQEGFGNIGSDDVSNQQLGRAQLDMARALEGHVGRLIPPNSDVSLPQFQTARQALAKNFTVAGALRGGNIDLQALARAQRADPQLLDGGLETLARYADENPDVTGRPSQYNAPSFAGDLQNIELAQPSTWLRAIGAGPLTRSLLTGDTSAAQAAAARLFPGRSPEAFGPLPPGPLDMRSPPGNVGVTPSQGGMPLPQGPGARPSLDLNAPLGQAFEPNQGELPLGATQPSPQGREIPLSHEEGAVGDHVINSPNGQSIAQESGPYLIEKRADTAAGAQGQGEGSARLGLLGQIAQSKGLLPASDVSVSPAAARMWAALKNSDYILKRNPSAAVNKATGNLVSGDGKPVFVAWPKSEADLGRAF
jgi:hypothetical protein